MDKILEAMQKDSFALTSTIEASGKIVRFDRDSGKVSKSGKSWYICFQNTTRKGDPFFVCCYGDWRDSSEYTFCDLAATNSDDRKFIEKQVADASRKRQAEQERLWEETALESATKWGILTTNTPSAYLDRKKVDGYNVKVEGGIVYVPVRDKDGKLWGMQKILADGSKFFVPGCKVKGNYHLIGSEESNEFLVCEGYATGASLHLATGLSVLVCFNASNMPEVCREFPDAQLTVCGDDDIYTPEEKGGNAGRKYAAKCAAGRIIFPRFKDAEPLAEGKKGPTDFNDLHVSEGIEEVRTQILSSTVERQFIIPLGHREQNYFYTSSSNRQIVKITRDGHNKNALRDLMPESYWRAMYPKGESWDLDAACDGLMLRCRKRGIFDDNLVRGVGAWKDGGTFLLNLGNSLYYNNIESSLDSLKSDFIYEVGKRMDAPKLMPLANDETAPLIEALKLIRFGKDIDHMLLLGWLVVAPVAGALSWRPHIWITGGSNTGKSTIMQGVVYKIIKKICHYFQGNTTEAGVRQTIKCDSKPVIFDEFETEDERSAQRIGHLVELMRQASSETDGQVAKGTPSGQAIFYRPRFSALVSSIRVSLPNEADRTRFTVLELKRKESGKTDNFDEFLNKISKINKIFVERFFSRTVKLLPVLVKNTETFWEVLRDSHSARIGQQYGTLLAGFWLLEHDKPITIEQAHEFLEKLNLDDAKNIVDDKEENECVDYLLKKNRRIVVGIGVVNSNLEKSISEMIVSSRNFMKQEKNDNGLFVPALERIGIRVTERDTLLIAQRHPELSSIFRNTKWANGWSKSLGRVTNAKQNIVSRIDGKPTRCTELPLDEVFDTWDGEIPAF